MANKKANTSGQSRQTKSTRKAPKVKKLPQNQKGLARDADGKFTSGSGGLERFKDFNWKRILPVIIVVALVGGFLVYRSFAADALLAVPGSDLGKAECTAASGRVIKESGGSKRNMSVCELSANKTITPVRFGDSKVKINNEAQFKSAVSSRMSATGYYQACYNIRNQGSSAASVSFGSYALGGSPSGGSTTSVSSTDYKTICDPVAHSASNTRPFLKVISGTVRIGSIGITSASAPKTPHKDDSPKSATRCPAFPAFPDANCTGTLPNVTRKDSGSIFTSKDGQVIENLNINGEIRVQHNNVVIRNVRIKSAGGQAIYILNNTNLLIEDCELDGQRKNAEAAVAFHNYTMRRCHIKNFGEGPRINGNVTLEDNYIHNFANFIPEGAHQDCVQTTSGSNIVIRHNTCLIGENTDGATYFDGANGSIFFSTSNGSNILIEKNLVGGGNWAINVDKDRYTGVTVKDNHFTTKVPGHEKGGYFGPISVPTGSVRSGNVWHDGPNAGRPVN